MSKLCIPFIGDDLKAQMGRKLDASEIADAIIKLRGGKAAVPDGLLVKLCKTFKDQLFEPLIAIYEEPFQPGRLPDSLRCALIALNFDTQ